VQANSVRFWKRCRWRIRLDSCCIMQAGKACRNTPEALRDHHGRLKDRPRSECSPPAFWLGNGRRIAGGCTADRGSIDRTPERTLSAIAGEGRWA